MKKPSGLFPLLVALAVVVAACSASDDEATVTGELEQSELTIGITPVLDVAPLYIALDRGFFADEGLTIIPAVEAGGAAAVPALHGGEIDMALGSYPSLLSAIELGVPLVIVQEATRSAEGSAGLYAMTDSGITDPADLVGKVIAVDQLNDIAQIAIEDHLVEAGLTLDDVTIVEVDLPDMARALQVGTVDVIATVEPYATGARTILDARLVAELFSTRLLDVPVAGWQTTAEFAENHPNTVAAFNRALARATAVATNDAGALASVLPTYTSVSPELAEQLVYPTMVSGLDTGRIQSVSELMAEQRLLDEPIDVAEHVFE